jgi:hypothetical protein
MRPARARVGETGRSTIRASLEAEVGDVLGGARGHRLLEDAKRKRDELLTPKKGEPRSQLKHAINEAVDAEKRVNEYERMHREYDQDIDELARLRRELARIESDRILEKARNELESVEKQAKAVEGFRQQDKDAGQAVALAKAELENVSDRWTRRGAPSPRSGHGLGCSTKRLWVDVLRATHRDRTADQEPLSERLGLFLSENIADPETEACALASAKAAEETARTAFDAAQREHATRFAVAKEKVATAEKAIATAKGELEAARKGITDGDLIAGLENARGVLDGKKLCKAETERQLAAANPEGVELRRKRAKETLERVTAEQTQLRDKANHVEGKLMGLGQSGIGELLDEARGARDRAIARRDRLQAEAEA